MNTTISQGRTYYPALDGLRGVASLLVVIYHNFGFINKYFFFGWLGLDIFFVLSGFLITDILLNTIGEKNYLRNFYVRRILRVFPLYYVSLILFLLILPRIPGLPIRLDYYTNNQIWIWTYLQNWLYIFNPPETQSALNHLWSLAVEEQFYLLWPLAIAVLRKPKYILVFITLVLLLTLGLRIYVWLNQVEDLAYYNLYTFTRVDGICIGCMVALLQKINTRFLDNNTSAIVFAFAGFNFLFYFINSRNNWSFPFLAMVGYTTFAMIIGLLIYQLINGGNRIFNLVFDNRILKFLGKVSYGCYIIHWPLYLIIRPYLVNFSRQKMEWMPEEFFASFIATALSYLAGYITFRFFEMRFLRLKKHFE